MSRMSIIMFDTFDLLWENQKRLKKGEALWVHLHELLSSVTDVPSRAGHGSGFKEADLGGKESSDPLMLCALEQHWRRTL